MVTLGGPHEVIPDSRLLYQLLLLSILPLPPIPSCLPNGPSISVSSVIDRRRVRPIVPRPVGWRNWTDRRPMTALANLSRLVPPLSSPWTRSRHRPHEAYRPRPHKPP